jgi:hypothetical protein
MQILVDLEGVLKGDKDQPLSQGIVMVGSLSAWNKITLISPLSGDQTRQWLDINKIVDFDKVIDAGVGLVGEDLGERQVNHARSLGAIDLFITNNPTLWAYTFNQGIASVMFGVPSYTRPEFRPDAPKRVRAWNDIEKAIEEQNAMRTQDARLIRTETLKFE